MNKQMTPARAGLRAKAGAVVGTALVSGSALAGGGGGFDGSAIESAITTNTGIAVGLVAAFILGIWTLRAMGLLKRG